ncbi:YiiD C-terminal domain-containing protein [Neptuniibacter sp. QD29_5]|uniref:YiiD C-terminal domain-containing protein n=1 Tax=Neptuniibacter sp. QD29_5 TaxID=3398207 RepID=UPI0039F5F822
MSEANSTTEFLTWLKSQIPLVNHMGVKPLDWDGKRLLMSAALAPNVNDKGTGFGGSLATLSTLCGWSAVTLYLRAQERDDDVVIRESKLEYFLPVTSDFTAECHLPDVEVLGVFDQKMQTKGRARMDLVIEIKQKDKVAMRLSGSYVAMEKQS